MYSNTLTKALISFLTFSAASGRQRGRNNLENRSLVRTRTKTNRKLQILAFCLQERDDVPGCSGNEACEQQVCEVDDHCCSIEWDLSCVEDALAFPECFDPFEQTDCLTERDQPGCGDAACEEIVCELDDYCCTGEWDDICVWESAIFFPECTGADPSNYVTCLQPQNGPGCGNEACEERVCELDDFCCNNRWDVWCAGEKAIEFDECM